MSDPLILGYHAVSAEWESGLAIPPERLREQAALLAGKGYTTLTLAETERQRMSGTLPAKTAVFTFDDGYRSTLVARDVLGEFGFVGTVFAVTDTIGSADPMSWDGIDQWCGSPQQDELLPMNWDQLEDLAAKGWEVASHTCSHPLLTGLDDDRLAEELSRSRELIATRLGSCETIAYPYGEADQRVAAATQAAGYSAGVTLTAEWLEDSAYLRPRVGLFREDGFNMFRVKISLPARWFRRSRAASALSRGSLVVRRGLSY